MSIKKAVMKLAEEVARLSNIDAARKAAMEAALHEIETREDEDEDEDEDDIEQEVEFLLRCNSICANAEETGCMNSSRRNMVCDDKRGYTFSR